MIEIHLSGQLSKPKTLSYIIEQALTVGVSPSTSSGEIEGQRRISGRFMRPVTTITTTAPYTTGNRDGGVLRGYASRRDMA